MKIECGDFAWSGESRTVDEAVRVAFRKRSSLPLNPSLLLRVHDGRVWHYIDFREAVKIAGYKTRVNYKGGFSVGERRRAKK